MEKEELIVDGFVFSSVSEAQIARKEKETIDIIRNRTPIEEGKICFELYSKLIEREMFKTMVGYSFLYELRQCLITKFGYSEESLPTVRLPKRMEYEKVNEINKSVLEARLERMSLIAKRLKIVIAALSFMIIAMFVIAAINPNAGYVNTEKKVLDKYASWQEELEKREQAVKEKEAELNMDGVD